MGAEGLFATSRLLQSSRTVISTRAPAHDYSEQVILLGRIKDGRALESRRVVHTFLVQPDLVDNSTLDARCSATLQISDIEWLPGLTGMPCEQCVMFCLSDQR